MNITLHEKHIGFGVLADLVIDPKRARGVTYKASRAAVKSVLNRERAGVMLVSLDEKLVAVTRAEARALGLPEVDAEWYQPRVTGEDISAVTRKLLAEL